MSPKTYQIIAIIGFTVSTLINYGMSNTPPGTAADTRSNSSYSGSSIHWGGGGGSWHK